MQGTPTSAGLPLGLRTPPSQRSTRRYRGAGPPRTAAAKSVQAEGHAGDKVPEGVQIGDTDVGQGKLSVLPVQQ